MVGLVEEIQRDVLDQAIPVSTLLRKVKLAAAKLQLAESEAWVDRELNGYDDAALPDYRQFIGVPKAHNPVHGWIDINAEAGVYERLSQTGTGQSIATLEQIAARRDGHIVVPLPREVIDNINRGNRFAFAQMSVFISHADVVAAIDQVRNLVLNWAIELERGGVLGEGISFSQQEKAAAQANQINIENFIGFIGHGNQVANIAGGNIDVEDDG